MKLYEIRAEFDKYFVIKDRWALDIVFATLIGNMALNRDPIWTLIVGPSSGGKTTLIAPAVSIKFVHFLDDLTEKTLLSGFKIKGKETSFLKKVGSGIIAISDFTSILAKNPNSRGEILTQLKLVYDGKLTKETGTGSLMWVGKMGFLGASTPDVYTYLENSRSMGERFLYYWLEQPTNQEIMDKQATHNLSAADVTKELSGMYDGYYQLVCAYQRDQKILLKMTPEQKQEVQDAAIFCVNGKATIHTDFKTGRPDAIPNISGVGRDSKIFDTLLHALQVMNCYELGINDLPVTDEMIQIVKKCAYSSINRERRKILEILVTHGGAMTSSQIGAMPGLGLEKDSVNKYLAPLHAVGMIKKKTGGGAHQWYIEDPKTITFIQEVSKTVVDSTHVEGIEEEPDESGYEDLVRTSEEVH